MEQDNSQEVYQEDTNEEEDYPEDACRSCGSTYIEEGHSIPLCTECRDKISKRPFPLWVKLFVAVVAVISVVSFINFPKALSAGLAYERAQKLEKQMKYISAAREYEKVIAEYPDSTIALSKLFLAYYNSNEIYTSVQVFDTIAGRELKNSELVKAVNSAISKIDEQYYPTEGFAAILDAHGNSDLNQIIEKILNYSKSKGLNNYEKFTLANYYYDVGNLGECKKLTNEIMQQHPDFYDAYMLLAAVAREEKDYDKAIEYCESVIENNVEHYSAIAAKARIELKRFNDTEALALAGEAYNINPNSSYAAATLALAYHFNNMTKERDEMFVLFENGSYMDDYNYNILKSVFKNGEKWRG